MDIVIKSFFRPYYLDRCLRSIKLNVLGSYTITILDDGTPDAYLDTIRKTYPEVNILKSDEYEHKVDLISKHLKEERPYSNKSIPVRLWKEFMSNCSDNFLMLEEDCWVTEKIAIDTFDQLMNDNDLLIVKLGWNNNEAVVAGTKVRLNKEVEEIIPNLPIRSVAIMKPYLSNVLKVKSILNRLKIVSIKFLLPYYSLYTVSSAFFNKNYWLNLWEDSKSTVNESMQLYRALHWYRKMSKPKYAKVNKEFVKTSFLTASTNRFKANSFDMIRLNHILNKAWMNDKLDSMENYPYDFNQSYLQQLVSQADDPLCTNSAWKEWIDLFKRTHREAGSNID